MKLPVLAPAMSQQSGGYSVKYDTKAFWSTIFQQYGSVWPRVFPFCFLNALVLAILQVLKHHGILYLQFSDKGHSFMGVILSFLVVSRVTTSLGRYNEARGYLSAMYRETRELVQNMVVLTRNQTDDGAKEWRNEVAYRSCLLLRTVMAVMDYNSEKIPAWDVPEMSEETRTELKRKIFLKLGAGDNPLRWAHKVRAEEEESQRVPGWCSYMLRCSIVSQSSRLAQPLHVIQGGKLISSVDSFMSGYYGIRKWLTTPTPFPLIQMTRTFLLLYLYSLPFALLSDMDKLVPSIFIIFILTYGFIGLEEVATQLDDPFGDDDNDFDNLGMAYTAFEDTYLLILDVDGPKWTDMLRAKMQSGVKGDGIISPHEGSSLLQNGYPCLEENNLKLLQTRTPEQLCFESERNSMGAVSA